jgi:hypothetical protein
MKLKTLISFGRVQKNTKKKLTVVVEHNSHQNQARAIMLEPVEQDINYLRKSIPRLKKNYKTLKDYLHECSNSNKIYEIECSASEEFNNSLITDFFSPGKTVPVCIKRPNSPASPFSIQENGLITLPNKFFLLYAIGFTIIFL